MSDAEREQEARHEPFDFGVTLDGVHHEQIRCRTCFGDWPCLMFRHDELLARLDAERERAEVAEAACAAYRTAIDHHLTDLRGYDQFWDARREHKPPPRERLQRALADTDIGSGVIKQLKAYFGLSLAVFTSAVSSRGPSWARVAGGWEEIRKLTGGHPLVDAFKARQADLAAALADGAALREAITRTLSYMEDAPELWGNPAADAVAGRLQRALARPERGSGAEG